MATSIVELLDQTERWRGQDGRWYRVATLDDGHLDNLIGYLERNARRLLNHRRWWEAYHGDRYDDPAAIPLEGVDAAAWLRDRPLYRALVAEWNRRGALDGEVLEVVADVEPSGARELEVRGE